MYVKSSSVGCDAYCDSHLSTVLHPFISSISILREGPLYILHSIQVYPQTSATTRKEELNSEIKEFDLNRQGVRDLVSIEHDVFERIDS